MHVWTDEQIKYRLSEHTVHGLFIHSHSFIDSLIISTNKHITC